MCSSRYSDGDGSDTTASIPSGEKAKVKGTILARDSETISVHDLKDGSLGIISHRRHLRVRLNSPPNRNKLKSTPAH